VKVHRGGQKKVKNGGGELGGGYQRTVKTQRGELAEEAFGKTNTSADQKTKPSRPMGGGENKSSRRINSLSNERGGEKIGQKKILGTRVDCKDASVTRRPKPSTQEKLTEEGGCGSGN